MSSPPQFLRGGTPISPARFPSQSLRSGRPGSPVRSLPSTAGVKRRRRALPHPRGFGPPQPYSSTVLAATWRHREAHLLRVLSTRNLDAIRAIFDSQCSAQKPGLTAVEFVQALLQLFSKVMFEAFDKQEFAVQVLELFAAIDVNGDKTMEWEELLDYVVQTVTSTVDLGLADNEADGNALFLSDEATGYHYQPMSVTDQTTKLAPEAGSDGHAPTAATLEDLFDDIYDNMKYFKRKDDWYMVCFRCGSPMVEVIRWISHVFEPRLEMVWRLKHGTALYSHIVLTADYIPDSDVIVSCSRKLEDGVPCANIYCMETGALLQRIDLDYPCLAVTYSPANRAYCFFTAAASLVYLVDVTTFKLVETISLKGSTSVHSAISLAQYGLDATVVGTASGHIFILLDRGWSILPGTLSIGHAAGVRSLAYSEKLELLVSIGNRVGQIPNPEEDANIVLVWDIKIWIDRLKILRRERNVQLAMIAHQTLKARREADDDHASIAGSATPPVSNRPFLRRHSFFNADAPRPSETALPALRPRMLFGHKAPVVGMSLYDGGDSVPHLVTSDIAGHVTVWHLQTFQVLQRLQMAPPPALPEQSLNTSKRPLTAKTPQKSETVRVKPLHRMHESVSTVPGAREEDIDSSLHGTVEFKDFEETSDERSRKGGAPQSRAGGSTRPAPRSQVNVETTARTVDNMRFSLGSKRAIQIVRAAGSQPELLPKINNHPQLTAVPAILVRRQSHAAKGHEMQVHPSAQVERQHREMLLKLLVSVLDDDMVKYVHGHIQEHLEDPAAGTAITEPGSAAYTTEHGDKPTLSNGKGLGGDTRAALILLIAHLTRKTVQTERAFFETTPASMNKTYSPPINRPVSGRSRLLNNAAAEPTDRLVSSNSTDYETDKILGLASLRKLPQSAVAAVATFPLKMPDSTEARIMLIMSGPSIPLGRSAALAQHGPQLAVMLAAANGGKSTTAMSGGREQSFNVHFAPLGSLLYRHGIAAYTWTPAMPPREGVACASFLSPTLSFASLCNSNLCIWDALTGRPLKTLGSKYVTQRAARHLGDLSAAADLISMCVDDRQRKVIVGDINGYIHVVNPLTGTVMKMLAPDPAMFDVKDEITDAPEIEGTTGDDGDDDTARRGDVKGLGVTQMKYATGHGEVLCISGRGTMWVSDESSLDGWERNEEGILPTCRRFHLPKPIVLREVEDTHEVPKLSSSSLDEVASDIFITQSGSFPQMQEAATESVASVPDHVPKAPEYEAKECAAPQPKLIALSARLNLCAVCCPLVMPDSMSKQTANAVSNTGYTVLIYDYRRATFLGALANPPATTQHIGTKDRSSSVQSSPGATHMPKSPRKSLRITSFISKDASPARIRSPQASDDYLPRLENVMDQLLPSISCMQFLDPLPALLTGHEDGSIRIWAVPPASYPYTCRMLWQVPDSVTLLPPRLLGQVLSRMEEVKLQASIPKRVPAESLNKIDATKRLLQELGVAPTGSLDAKMPLPVVDEDEGASTEEMQGAVEAPSSGVHSRIPTAVVAFAAGMAQPMCTGVLGAQGHTRFLPEPPKPSPAPDTLERVASKITLRRVHQLPADKSTGIGGPLATPDSLLTSDGYTAEDMLTPEGLTKFHEYPCADKGGMIVWVGDSDGEIHRWYISPKALVRAGLNIVRKLELDPSACLPDESAFKPGVLSLDKIVVALQWSGRFHTSRHAAINRELILHGVEDTFGVPIVEEVFPPPPCNRIEHRPMDEEDRRLMPLGACWEGSWRAHGNGDVHVTALQVIHDTGAHLLMSAANDGVSRVWDPSGHMLGTLDPNPRYQPLKPESRHAAMLLEADVLGEPILTPLQMIDLDSDDDDDDFENFHHKMAHQRPAEPTVHLAQPGFGSGLSFDGTSLSHVCASRVYHNSAVPHEAGSAYKNLLHSELGLQSFTFPNLRFEAGQYRPPAFSGLPEGNVIFGTATTALADPEQDILLSAQMLAILQSLVLSGIPTGAVYEVNERTIGTKAMTAAVVSLLQTVLQQRKIPGLRYASSAFHSPAIGPVKWHLKWDLRGRYIRQCQSATEALALCSLTKMRLLRGFHDRIRSHKSVTKKLAFALRASSKAAPLPPTYPRVEAAPGINPATQGLRRKQSSFRRLQSFAVQPSPRSKVLTDWAKSKADIEEKSEDSTHSTKPGSPSQETRSSFKCSSSSSTISRPNTAGSIVGFQLPEASLTSADVNETSVRYGEMRKDRIQSMLKVISESDTMLISSRAPSRMSSRGSRSRSPRSPGPSEDATEQALELLSETRIDAPSTASILNTNSVLVERLKKEGSKLAAFYGKRTVLLADARMMRKGRK